MTEIEFMEQRSAIRQELYNAKVRHASRKDAISRQYDDEIAATKQELERLKNAMYDELRENTTQYMSQRNELIRQMEVLEIEYRKDNPSMVD